MRIKVFAHHKDIFRWRTLIQVGDDWTIRGTVFMKNPGSSKPTTNLPTDQELYNLNMIGSSADWFNFTVDPTMNAVINLFTQRAEAKGKIFEGIIQIFNVSNVMSPSVNKGIALYQLTENSLKTSWQDDIKALISPIYIGWGDFYRKNLFKQICASILSAVQEKEDISYLATAGFTHPFYLMRYGAKIPKCIYTRESFCKR